MSLATVCARCLLAMRRRVLGWNLQILIDRPRTSTWTVLSVTRKSDQVLPCFRELVFEAGPGKIFVGWRPLSRCNPIHTLKPPANAIMQTLLPFLLLPELPPGTLMIAGTISLSLLAIFLHHKLG